MLQKLRGQRSFKSASWRTKLTAYILFLTLLGFVIFFINSLLLSQKPLFISPIGENNIDTKKIEKILKDNDILVSNVLVASDYSYEIVIPNNVLVKLSSKKDINKQVASLQRILRELTIEGKPFKSIDFRFEEPIISF